MLQKLRYLKRDNVTVVEKEQKGTAWDLLHTRALLSDSTAQA